MGRENETEQARQRRILADRERKRLARSCETLEMKMKRNEADKIRKRLMRGMETPEAKQRRREAERQRRQAARMAEQQRKPSTQGVIKAPTEPIKPPLIYGIPLTQGGLMCEGKEVTPPEVCHVNMKQFPSTIQKLPLLLREEMQPIAMIPNLKPYQMAPQHMMHMHQLTPQHMMHVHQLTPQHIQQQYIMHQHMQNLHYGMNAGFPI